MKSGTLEHAPPQYKPTHRRAVVATVSLALVLATEPLWVGIRVIEHSVFADWQSRTAAGDAGALLFALAMTGCSAIYGIAWVVSVVMFLRWLYRIAENAQIYGGHRVRTSPAMSVAYWFIPIVGLYRPYQVVKSLYWASHPPRSKLEGDWVGRMPAILPLWWTTWVVANLVGNVSLRLWFSDRPNASSTAVWLDVAALPFSTVSGVCALAVVWSIQARQESRALPPSSM